jgi:hypothetical protein
MLDSLPKFAELLLWNNVGLLPRSTTAPPTGASETRLAPQDPTTLALAIVGLATLAIYLAATGWRPSRNNEVRPSPTVADASDQPQPTDTSETPTRDAA